MPFLFVNLSDALSRHTCFLLTDFLVWDSDVCHKNLLPKYVTQLLKPEFVGETDQNAK